MPKPDPDFVLLTEPVQRVVRGLSSGTSAAPRLLLLRGEDGLGKSSAARHAVAQLPNALVLHGTSNPGRLAYHPIAEALASVALRAGRSRNLREAAVAVGAELLRLVPILGAFGGSLVQLYRDWGVRAVEPITEQIEITFQVQKIFTRLAEKHHVVVIFEDVGLYDGASLSLLESLLKHGTLPVSLVLTLDPLTRVELSGEERERFDRFELQIVRSGFQPIDFPPFDFVETRRFLDGYLAPNTLQRAQVEAVHEISGGNPLFLRELLTHLEQEGVLRSDGGSFSIPGDYAFNAVPQSMSQLIDLRIRRLQAELRNVIDVAAVLGPEFSPHPISGTLKLEHMVTLRRLKEIEATHRLIVETARAHVFTYRSVRDRIYAQLGPALAREHHLLIANYLKQHPSLSDNEFAVYSHFAQAGEMRRALDHLRNAAYESRARCHFAVAAERFREAARLTREFDGDADAADELLFQSALASANAGIFTDAIASFERLTEHARQPALRAGALLQLGLARWIGDGPDEAKRDLNVLLERHAGELDERSEVDGRLALSSILYHVGEWETARSHYRKCFRTRAVASDAVLRARARRCINMFYTCETALPLLNESLRDVQDFRDVPLYWELRHNVACNHMMFGELADARAMFEEILRWFDNVGTYRAIYTENNLGIISLAERDYDQAERRFRRVAATPVSPFERISAECQLGVLRLLRNDPGGIEQIEALVPEVCARAESFTREMVFHNLGWAQMRLGREEEAAANLLRALPEHRSPASVLETGRVHTLLRRLADSGVRVDIHVTDQADLLQRTGRRERWWYTAMEYKSNDLWCWE